MPTNILEVLGLRPVEIEGLARLGARNDGGYVVPLQAITRARLLLSFGVSIEWSFERACVAGNPRLVVLAYDHTVGPAFFLRFGATSFIALLLRLLMWRLDKMKLSLGNLHCAIDYFRFFRGRVRHVRRRVWHNTGRGSESIDVILDSASQGGSGSIFAKIDIEGGEYRILPAVIRNAELFTGLAIEFHDTDLCREPLRRLIAELREHFHVAHVHGNNYCDLGPDALPTALEVTFIHKSLLDRPPPAFVGSLPREGLDAPNDPLTPDFALQS